MGTAFSTSLFGLSASGVIGLLGILLRRMHDQLKRRLEKWLNDRTELLAKMGSDGPTEFPTGQDTGAQLAPCPSRWKKTTRRCLKCWTPRTNIC